MDRDVHNLPGGGLIDGLLRDVARLIDGATRSWCTSEDGSVGVIDPTGAVSLLNGCWC